jgi:hypothetical protein
MTKFVCDRCGKVIEDDDRRHVSYTGGNEADLCKGCFEEFLNCLNWMKNKPFNADELNKKIGEYDKAVKGYNERISVLTDALNHATDDRDWWRAQCKGLYESVYDLNERARKILDTRDIRAIVSKELQENDNHKR